MSNAPKTTKCLDITVEGRHFVCTFTPAQRNPYQLYSKWYEQGWHKRKLVEYANFYSVLCWLKEYAERYTWGWKDYFPEYAQNNS